MINVVEKIKKEDITSKAYAEATLLISVLDLGYSLSRAKNRERMKKQKEVRIKYDKQSMKILL